MFKPNLGPIQRSPLHHGLPATGSFSQPESLIQKWPKDFSEIIQQMKIWQPKNPISFYQLTCREKSSLQQNPVYRIFLQTFAPIQLLPPIANNSLIIHSFFSESLTTEKLYSLSLQLDKHFPEQSYAMHKLLFSILPLRKITDLLKVAAKKGDEELVTYIMEHRSWDQIQEKPFWQAVFTALENKQEKIAIKFLQDSKWQNLSLVHLLEGLQTAARHGLTLFIEHFAKDPSWDQILKEGANRKASALKEAVYNNHLKVVHLLIKKEIPIDFTQIDFLRCITHSIDKGFEKIAICLLPKVEQNQLTIKRVMILASSKGRKDLLQYLLQYKKEISEDFLQTLTTVASDNKHKDLVDLLNDKLANSKKF